MVRKRLLCVIEVMALISHVRCMAAGYEKDTTCGGCKRQPPMLRGFVVEEDLFHLKHTDPCHGVSKNDPRKKESDASAISLCRDLSQLYFQSELFRGGQQSSVCKEYTHHGCIQFGFDPKYNCMVHIKSSLFSSSRHLSDCVEEDLKRYRARTQLRGAQYTASANPEIQRKYGDLNVTLGTPRATEQSRSPRRTNGGRGRSPSPPRADGGRSTSFRRHLLGSLKLRRSRKIPSQSARNPAVMSSATMPPPPSGKFKYH